MDRHFGRGMNYQDLKTAERQRPSPEQVSSQKGVEFAGMLFKSAVTDVPPIDEKPLLVINLMGYVEDHLRHLVVHSKACRAASFEIQKSEEVWAGWVSCTAL